MKILTLIPDARSYGVMTLMMLGASCFLLPARICLGLCGGNFNYFLQINAAIKFLIAMWGCFIIPVSSLFSDSLSMEVTPIIIGSLLGFCMIIVEAKLNRFYGRNQKRNQSQNLYVDNYEVKKVQTVLSLTSKKWDRKNIDMNRTKSITHNSVYFYSNLISILSMAISEEIIFRGYFISFAKTFPLFFCYFFIVISVYIFGTSHIVMGKHQAFLKGIYGALFVFLTYIFESISAAIIAHIILNAVAWKSSSSDITDRLSVYLPK